MYKKSVIIPLILLISVVGVQAEDSEIGDIINSISKIELESGYDYNEIGTMRMTTLSYLYGQQREGIAPEIVDFSRSVRDFLYLFESAHKRTINDNAIENEEAISKMVDLKKKVNQIESQSTTGILRGAQEPQEVAGLASRAVEKFLDDEGDYFMELYEDEEVTPLKIIYLANSINAYTESGNTADKNKAEEEYLLVISEFNEDMTTVNTKNRRADALIKKARANENATSPLDLFYTFMDTRSAISDYSTAERTCVQHKLDSNETVGMYEEVDDYHQLYVEISSNQDTSSEFSNTIFGRLIKYIIVTLVILLIISILLARAYIAYRYDTYDTTLSDELVLAK